MTFPGRSPGGRLVLVLTCLLMCVGATSATASTPFEIVGSPVISTLPGSRAGAYATPVIVAQPGDAISFVNTDVFLHSVRSVATGPDNTSWCKPWSANEPVHPKRNPRQFPKGKCPLLWSLPISMTVGAVQTKVYGTENLRPGTTVDFYCTVFPSMQGSLIVQ
jgi:plastocyanin